MQGTNWVKVSKRRPKLDEPVLLYSIGEIMAAVYVLSWNSIEGEVRAGWMINLGSDFYDSYNHKWFYETEVSHWCDLPLPPMPEGE